MSTKTNKRAFRGKYLCEDCDHREDPYKQGYCYMFKDKPFDDIDGCAQHSAAPKLRGKAAHLLLWLAVMAKNGGTKCTLC